MDDGKNLETVGNLFATLFSDLRGSKGLFEDLVAKADRLSKAIETAAVASHMFLDTFQKIADAAISAKGATRELGTALTKMCMRHRAIEVKAADISRSLTNSLVQPVTGLIREWDKTTRTLEADHERESRKAVKSAKRAAQDTIKRVKETDKMERKGKDSAGLQDKMEESMKTASESYQHLEDVERFWMRKLLIEQRGRYCKFVQCFRPVVEREIALMEEATHVHTILADTLQFAGSPNVLPPSSEHLIEDLKLADPVSSIASPVATRRSRALTGDHSPSPRRLPDRSSSTDSMLSNSPTYTNGSVTYAELSPPLVSPPLPSDFPPPPSPPSIGAEAFSSPSGIRRHTETLPPPPPPDIQVTPRLPPPNRPRPDSLGGVALPIVNQRSPSLSHGVSPLAPLQQQQSSSDEDDEPAGSLLAALKNARLKKVATNDRSGPKF